MAAISLLIAGGTGLIGSAVQKEAEAKGWSVSVLSRRPGKNHIVWDPEKGLIRIEHPVAFDAIINLTGASLARGRWTASRKKVILQSRLDSVSTIASYIHRGLLSAKTYIGASGVGIYGNRGEEILTEESPVATTGSFIAEVANVWEDAHARISQYGLRVSSIRIGLVLSRDDGALKSLLEPAHWGILPVFGHGRHFWPWIHIHDVARLMVFVVENHHTAGPVNAVSPHPVRHKKFIQLLNNTFSTHRIRIRVPHFLLKLILGEMSSMLYESQHVLPTKAQQYGFRFLYPELKEALDNLRK